MSGQSEPTSPSAAPDAGTGCDSIAGTCPLMRYHLTSISLSIDAPNNKFNMNDPDSRFQALAIVNYTETTDADDLETLPTIIKFSFTDTAPNNTAKNSSFEYSAGNFLGKRSDATAISWEAHADNAATSDDAFNQTANVTATHLEADHRMTAKIYFKPSGVGGDDFKINAALLAEDGTTQLLSAQTVNHVVWRSISFTNIYEMTGETHVSTNASTASISPVYTPAFVDYSAGSRTP